MNYTKVATGATGAALPVTGVSYASAFLMGLTLLVIGFAILASARRRKLDRIHVGK